MILHLHLKGEYFDAIERGEKKEEYRKMSDHWINRLSPPKAGLFTEIWLYRGYPSRDDKKKILKRKYRGYRILNITHPQFGKEPVRVFAIDVSVLV